MICQLGQCKCSYLLRLYIHGQSSARNLLHIVLQLKCWRSPLSYIIPLPCYELMRNKEKQLNNGVMFMCSSLPWWWWIRTRRIGGVVNGGEDKGWVGVVKGFVKGGGVVNNSSTLPWERSQYTRHSNLAFCFGNSCLVIFIQGESCRHNGNKSFNGIFRTRLRWCAQDSKKMN